MADKYWYTSLDHADFALFKKRGHYFVCLLLRPSVDSSLLAHKINTELYYIIQNAFNTITMLLCWTQSLNKSAVFDIDIIYITLLISVSMVIT